MYSKDRQASISNNPTVYRTIRTSIKDNSSRSHESGGPCTPLFGPKTSYFADRQDTNDRHQTQPSPQISLSNRSRNDRKQDHIVQVTCTWNRLIKYPFFARFTYRLLLAIFVRTFTPKSHKSLSKVESNTTKVQQELRLSSTYPLRIL